MTSFDIVVVGAGPVGLAFAASLAASDLKVALIDRQSMADLAQPAFDGREIALTHASIKILRELGAWDAIPCSEKSPLFGARVLNGSNPFALSFDAPAGCWKPLGVLVPNHWIRNALFSVVRTRAHARLFAGCNVVAAQSNPREATVTLSDGRQLKARLLVAADSRLSALRDLLHVAAEINRLGCSMLICRVRHEVNHHRIATEWFDHRQTIAMLPLAEGMSSLLVTLPANEVSRLLVMDDAAFLAEMTRRCCGRLGKMSLASSRHAYSLVTTWAHRFWTSRAALIGDAAVGMHPVTAHGFNIGLGGQNRLAQGIVTAWCKQSDIADPTLLRRYEIRHRLTAAPLYHATNMLVKLYTDERPLAQAARHVGLRVSQNLPFVRRGISAFLRR
ncbi:5-demethoxyubiquinol-8 5-hydroxylase UbiM [Mesorhizobium sp. WSM3224]|uniref:5-demethoxyubiquinol-8 5-hydroxylase UbiM n=1 Tax=Mesorhizobium sp. WSM3224 TaxID=1040986 RepID=UPI0004146535|nr:5-demethoxyubiquinol-8 5-hydroxylase UbiM [Mesorhizobium sp. WSM3224]